MGYHMDHMTCPIKELQFVACAVANTIKGELDPEDKVAAICTENFKIGGDKDSCFVDGTKENVE